MAYTADIQIGVKGANQLRELQDRLEKISREIDLIGARDLFENKAIQSINEYSRALSVAEDNLRDVTLGSDQETAAIREYVQALGEANAARARQNRLIRAQVAAQEAARRTISPAPTGFSAAEFTPALPPSLVRAAEVKQSWNTFFGKAGEVAQDLSRATQTRENAIKQSWNIFFGKAEEVAADLNQLAKTRESQVKQSWARFFSQAQEVAVDLNQQAKVRALNVKSSWARFFREVEEFAEEQTRQTQQARQRTGQGRIGAAAIGAGFPLLFGGGPGAILGGGLGGALGGKEFGFEASVALSALGTVFDRLVGSARNLGDALRAPESALDALQEVGFKVSASTESQVRSLIEAGDRTAAYNLLLQETGVRPEQVNALRDLDDAFDDLQSEFAGLFVTVATELTPAIVVVAGLITKLVKSLTGPDVQRAAANLDPEAFEQARGQAIRETSFFGFFGNQEKFEKRLTELSRDIVNQAAPGIEIDPDRSGRGNNTKVNTLAEELVLQKKIGEEIKAGSNLLDKNAFLAAENVIAAKLVLALKKAEGDEQKEAIAFQEARNSMGRLEARRQRQQASLTEKTAREQERAANAAERQLKAANRLAERVQQQDTAAANRVAILEKQLDIATESSDLSKIDLEFDLKRTRVQQRYAKLISKSLSDQEKEKLEKELKLNLELLSIQRNEKISGHMRDQFESAMQLNGELLLLTTQATGLSDEFQSLANTINNEIINGIEGMIDGTKTLGQVASSMLKKIASQMFQTAIMGPSGSGGIAGMLFGALGIGGGGGISGFAPSLATSGTNFFGGGFSPMSFFANGGRPPVGRPSVVGERGPELFVPRSSGTIVPNHALGGSANVTVNVDASGSSVEGNADQAGRLGKAIGIAVQQELIKQKRPGGLLGV